MEFEAAGEISRFIFNKEHQNCDEEKYQTGHRFERIVLGIREDKIRVCSEVAFMSDVREEP